MRMMLPSRGLEAASRQMVSFREELGSPEAAASGKEDSRARGDPGVKRSGMLMGWSWKSLSFKETDCY